MKGVPWLHEPRSAFNVGDWPLLKQTQQAAVSLSLYPPKTIYMYSPKGTFISFLSVWSLPKGLFVHIAISSCITYYSDRQVDGQFLRCRGGRPYCSFTYMYLAQASTGRPLSPAGKNRFISRATFVTWQKWGEVHARGLHHIHIQTVGVGKFQTYGTYTEIVSTPLQLTDIYISLIIFLPS